MQLARLFISFFLFVGCQAWALENDEIFSRAREAYGRQDDVALAGLSRQLHAQNYSLAPYADYWHMLLRLSEADHTTVNNFLTRYADLPFTDRLRGEWLKQLAKRQDWTTFFAVLPDYQLEETAIRCHALHQRAKAGNLETLREARSIWLVGRDQPASCDPLFEYMIGANVLTADDVWARFRLALQNGKLGVAKSTVKRLPGFDAASLKLLDRAHANPQQALEKRLIPLASSFGREINLYALERVYRTQPALALDLWNKLQAQFSVEQQHYLWGRLALHAARKHERAALQWFSHAETAALDQEQLAWKTRAALRERDWPLVEKAIAAMSSEQQQEAVWRYWKARALKEQQKIPQANAILAQLSREHHYHGLLAEEELGDVLGQPPNLYRASEQELKAIRQMPGIERALELYRLGSRWESRAEWAWAVRNLNDRQLIAAAEIAFRAEWFDVAINTAEKTRLEHDFNLRYPTPYRDIMKNYARENGLDEAWVYGLIRQESRFVSQARSSAGASGLMQVMPATAKWIAKRLGLAGFTPSMINELDTNLRFGTHYLRYTLDRMDGQSLMATAGYNAGPSRPRQWLGKEPMEGAIYAETIPFTETRDYVKKVMSNAYYYARRLGTKNETLKQRLGMIPARADSAVIEEK